MGLENLLSDSFNFSGEESRYRKCGCAFCQPNSAHSNFELELHQQLSLSTSLELNYRELVWDYQGLRRNIGNSENVEYSLYEGPWEFTKTYNHRGHELGAMWHSLEQLQFIESVFIKLDSLIDLDFKRVESGQTGDIRIYRAYRNSDWSNRFPDPNSIGGGTMYGQPEGIDIEWRDMYSGDAFNAYEKTTIVHEIGHALGLSHPGGVGENPGWDVWNSIMSYNNRPGLNEDPVWFRPLDIQALQSIWGAEDDQLVSNLVGTAGADFISGLIGQVNSETIDGSDGNDTLRGYGGGDYLIGGNGNDLMGGNFGRDTLVGGAGNDEMNGGQGGDDMSGGAGADIVRGGAGKNTISAGANDGATDQIYVHADSVLYGRPTDGSFADLLNDLGANDRIYIHGVEGSQLSFQMASLPSSGEQGVGIFANGALEAVVTGGLGVDQVNAMTEGGFF
ncbi:MULTISPECIES: hypothetical protein [unclassified Synechococcus]|uniref:hypothetical protein n=1 Tax=unclassified Synechococcus TaxID=2626047 RepID=UPI001CF900A4|nr:MULTISPECIES: hypothetical protein [unclassified Synechococcus]MCB4377613.1 hypothetical protein [Synechococcus sp. MU1650]